MSIRSKQREKYRELKRAGRFCGTIKRAMRLWAERQERARDTRPREQLELIPLGPELRGRVRVEARTLRPRLRNWEDPRPDRTSRTVRVEEINNGRYSGRCTYTHWTYAGKIRCCGIVTPGIVLAFIGDQRIILHAPRGWTFGRDALGLYVVRKREVRRHYRYHFHSGDLSSKSAMRDAARDHEQRQREEDARERERRQQERKRERLREVVMELGVHITFEDSLRAGNCRAGTVRWCRDHAISPHRTYPLETLQRIAGRDANTYQFRRVVDAAIDRSIEDMERGWCPLMKQG